MGLIDNMQGGDMSSMRARYDELSRMEQEGTLDDKGREELNQLRMHMGQ